ncbi:cytochrome c oxidase assembly protein [Pseudonocardia xinjiangensis]|uniref:Cytochrome c oxidase assembly protein n=1 Tax=Pseudonocardia xinjiangensis TaxID=75289 RepID=A0ABX1RKU9_9PSEU|nr:cytochrome c oxidase assembly protein [Pseudonocardia xinjiangensis]NMH80119.1 cytochrome c oxidase assembly protein [Pseudonocardia xinjiangensis]
MIDNAPSWWGALAFWRFSPAVDLVLVLVTVAYLLLARRPGADGSRWPPLRTTAWLGAVVVLVVALDGPVAVFADVLFWVHMVQHLLLIMVVPVLLVWAQPWRLVHDAGGARARSVVDRVVGSRAARWGTAPLCSLGLYAAVVILTHLTGFQQVSVTDPAVRAAELALYLVSGYLLFLPLAGAELVPWSPPHLARFALLALSMGVDTLTGVVLMLTPRPLAPAYAAAHPGWGPTALADQEAAGAIMWFGGDVLMLVLMVAVAVRWGTSQGQEQGLGRWIEGVRHRTLLGADAVPADGASGDVDADERALQAYNAALAALHTRDEEHRS